MISDQVNSKNRLKQKLFFFIEKSLAAEWILEMRLLGVNMLLLYKELKRKLLKSLLDNSVHFLRHVPVQSFSSCNQHTCLYTRTSLKY